METADDAGDWALMAGNARRYLAVNPMVLAPQQYLARAAEAVDDPAAAIRSWENCLHLEDPDPAQAHFQLAKLLRQSDPPGARLHVLKALEEAPRFRDAHTLLLELHREHPEPKLELHREDPGSIPPSRPGAP
jgi:hypothetical protein